MFFEDKNLDNLEISINNELIQITQWLIANRLTLNVDKSNLIIFQNNAKLNLKISLDGEILKQAKFVKYLGVIIDEKLS